MATLPHPWLFEREFGSAMLHATTFRNWLTGKGLHIDAGPGFFDDEFIYVERLLVAVAEAAVNGLSLEHASAIVANDKSLRASFIAKGHSEETKAMFAGKLASFDGGEEEILVGAIPVISGSAHQKWRELISRTVENGELVLLDHSLKLPLPGPSSATNSTIETAAEIQPAANWKMRVQEEAAARWRRYRANGANPTKNSIKSDLSTWCRENDIRTTTGINPDPEYIARHVLRDWSPPDDSAT